MILVNLLPYHLRPVKRTPLPALLSLTVLVVAVLGMAGMYLGVRGAISRVRADIAVSTAEYAKLSDVVEEYNALTDEKKGLQDKITIIQEILKDRILWSKQLHRLVSLTPENIWYSNIKVVEQPFREEVKEYDQRTKKEVIKKITVNKKVLEVSGYAVEDEFGNTQINPLSEKTASDEEFSAIFEFIRPTVKDTTFDNFKVREFTFEYLVNPGGKS